MSFAPAVSVSESERHHKYEPVITVGELILFGSIRITIITFRLLAPSHEQIRGRFTFINRQLLRLDGAHKDMSTDKDAREPHAL